MKLKDIVKQRRDKFITTTIPIEDVDKPLLMVLFGISINGIIGYDEDVVEIMVGEQTDFQTKGKKMFNETFVKQKEEHGRKLVKSSVYMLNPEGRIVFVPKI